MKEIGLERLKCDEEEWQFIWEHISEFCIASDLKVKEKFGETANEEEILQKDKMSDEEFIEFAIETIQETLDRLGYKKSKRKKKKQLDDAVDDTYDLLLQQQRVAQTNKLIDQKVQERCPC